MKALNVKLLREFLKRAGNTLQGNWVLVGGALLPAVGLDIRSTVDIDIVGLGEMESGQSLALMDIAASLDLPIETPNQAASFFLRKISYTKADLLPLISGKTAKIFRPSVSLYWKLKLVRLSETDVIDCQHYFGFCKGQSDPIDTEELDLVLDKSIISTTTPEKKARIASLRGLLK